MVSDFHANFITIRYSMLIATDILNAVLSVVFPAQCVGCGNPGTWICETCSDRGFIRSPAECMVCRTFSEGFVTHRGCGTETSLKQVLICWEYTDLAKKIIKTVKSALQYKIVKEISSKAGEIALTYLPRDCLFVPVPTSPSRILKRGFNQTDIIAKAIGKYIGSPIVNLLEKVETREHQTGKNRADRKNIDRRLFYVSSASPKIPHHHPIVLVDDLCTTGSTLSACASVLSESGYREITALALFRGKSSPVHDALPSARGAGRTTSRA